MLIELGDKILLLGVAGAVAAGILRHVHLARIIQQLKKNHKAIWESLAGGKYRRNPLIFRLRIKPLLDGDELQQLRDEELNGRIRMLKIFQYGVGLSLIITILGVFILIYDAQGT